VAVPCYLSAVYAINYINFHNGTSSTVYPYALSVATSLQGFVQFVSYVFLAIGLFKIRSFLKNSAFRHSINNRMMHLHFLLFTLYLIGGLILLIVQFDSYATDSMISEQLYIVMMIVSTVLDTAVSLAQAFIFLKLGKVENNVIKQQSTNQIQVNRSSAATLLSPPKAGRQTETLAARLSRASLNQEDCIFELSSPLCLVERHSLEDMAMSRIVTNLCKPRKFTT
jgi:hypothetical protein